jgi:hypothetical protein
MMAYKTLVMISNIRNLDENKGHYFPEADRLFFKVIRRQTFLGKSISNLQKVVADIFLSVRRNFVFQIRVSFSILIQPMV